MAACAHPIPQRVTAAVIQVASQIPNCRAKFCEGEGHLLLFAHWEEVLDRLMGGS